MNMAYHHARPKTLTWVKQALEAGQKPNVSISNPKLAHRVYILPPLSRQPARGVAVMVPRLFVLDTQGETIGYILAFCFPGIGQVSRGSFDSISSRRSGQILLSFQPTLLGVRALFSIAECLLKPVTQKTGCNILIGILFFNPVNSGCRLFEATGVWLYSGLPKLMAKFHLISTSLER